MVRSKDDSKKDSKDRRQSEADDGSDVGDAANESHVGIPIAFPLAPSTSKLGRNILKLVQAATKGKLLSKGIKDVTRTIRKKKLSGALCVLAADVTPMDFVSHLPVHCERHNIPYVWVSSRVDLGLATLSKGPVSAALLIPSSKVPDVGEKIGKAVKKIEKLPKS